MYYQVIIETSEKIGKAQNNRKYYEFDKTDVTEIIDGVVIPYLKKQEIQFDGYFLKPENIARIAIKQTEKTANVLSEYENNHMPSGVLMYVSKEAVVEYDKHTKDVTKVLFQEAREKIEKPGNILTDKKNADFSKIFVVHGRDELAKTEVARFVEKMGFEPIILHEQVSIGMTIIEKIEHYSNVNFGIVVYTPCDIGSLKGDEKQRSRARQNVVFEHGYLMGKLKRENICALVKGDVETPNDISGVVYISMDENKAWMLLVAKELKRAGYSVDMNKL